MSIDRNKPIILAFVGMPGAGKDTCSDYVAKKSNVPVIHFGNMVYDEVNRRGLDIIQHEKEVRMDMRAKEGPAVLAKRVVAKVHEYIDKGEKRIVLNGLYSWSEYKHLSQEFGEQFVCIAITAPRALRYKRVVERKDAHRPYTVEQVIEREVAEIEHMEKGGPIASADYTLTNSKTPEDLFSELDSVLAEIGF